MYNGPWKHHVTSSPTASIFSDFFDIFTFSTASLSIIGNAHWTLKTAHPTSSSTVSTIPYFFSWFFSILLLLFIWKSAHFLIWKYALDPENITQHHHQPSLFFFWFFPHFIVIFTFSTALPSIYGNVQWTLKTVPYPIFIVIFSAILFICKCNFFYGNVHWTLKWWGCHEGMKLLLKWKNEMFCGRDLEWNTSVTHR